MKTMLAATLVALMLFAAGCKTGESRTQTSKDNLNASDQDKEPANTKESTAEPTDTTPADYMPAEYYLAFQEGRVPEHWRSCLMTSEPAGASGEAEMTDVTDNSKFFTSKFLKTRPATAEDIKVGATVYVLVKWGVAVRENGAAAAYFKERSHEWLETTVTGTEGLDSGLFQAPHREQNDIPISNARVAE